MAEREYFRNESGSTMLSGDGTFYTSMQSADWDNCIVVIAAYDANGDIVTPSAGLAEVEASPIDGQWHKAPSGGANPIDLTLTGADASYSIPYFEGPIVEARIVISGTDVVTDGIDHFKAFCWRS